MEVHFSKLGNYKIDDSITFTVEYFSDGVNFSCKQLNLYSTGENYDESKKDLIDEIDFAWSEYVIGDKSKLTDKAIEYGKMLRKHIVRM